MRLHRGFTGVVVLSCVAAVAGCAKKDAARSDTVAASTAVMTNSSTTTTTTSGGTMPTPIALADVAGKWKMSAKPSSGTDTVPTTYTLVAAPEPTGWSIIFDKGPTVAQKVAVAGDSITLEGGPYKSVRRKGVDVTTHTVFRKQGDQLVGTTTAHYKSKGADSVLVLTTSGTRTP